jgi:hypothetical protein
MVRVARRGGEVTQVGERVLALMDASGDTARVFGYGTYMGDEVPIGAAGCFGPEMAAANMTNPKIMLDNGKVVWGCECWWGPEVEMGRYLAGRTVVEVDIDAVRKQEGEEGK